MQNVDYFIAKSRIHFMKDWTGPTTSILNLWVIFLKASELVVRSWDSSELITLIDRFDISLSINKANRIYWLPVRMDEYFIQISIKVALYLHQFFLIFTSCNLSKINFSVAY